MKVIPAGQSVDAGQSRIPAGDAVASIATSPRGCEPNCKMACRRYGKHHFTNGNNSRSVPWSQFLMTFLISNADDSNLTTSTRLLEVNIYLLLSSRDT